MSRVAGASAFRLYDQGASAAGQADAFTAQADDASAIYYNPAGMTQLRSAQAYLGANFVGGHTTFTGPAATGVTGDLGGSFAFPPPSNVYIAAPLSSVARLLSPGDTRVDGDSFLGRAVVGLGLIGPFGIKYRWPDTGPFNTAVTRAALPLLDIKPTVAYRLNDSISLGLGMDIYTLSGLFGEGHYELRFVGSPVLGALNGRSLEVNGSDTALGFNISFMYTPEAFLKSFDAPDGNGGTTSVRKPLVSIGFVYRSQATLHLDGNFIANGTALSLASTTLVLPQVFTGGVSIWPMRDLTREWKLELDVDYTGWKSIRNLNINNLNFIPGGTLPVPANWNSQFTIMVGTEYKLVDPAWLQGWDVAVRGGYWFAKTPVPDATFTPAVPSADDHLLAIGTGVLCKKSTNFLGVFECGKSGSRLRPQTIGLDLSYQALLYETRTVTGNNNPTVNGNYHSLLHFGSINVRVAW